MTMPDAYTLQPADTPEITITWEPRAIASSAPAAANMLLGEHDGNLHRTILAIALFLRKKLGERAHQEALRRLGFARRSREMGAEVDECTIECATWYWVAAILETLDTQGGTC